MQETGGCCGPPSSELDSIINVLTVLTYPTWGSAPSIIWCSDAVVSNFLPPHSTLCKHCCPCVNRTFVYEGQFLLLLLLP